MHPAQHSRQMNAHYQATFRAPHQSPEEADRIQRRIWWVQGMKYQSESLDADGWTQCCRSEIGGFASHASEATIPTRSPLASGYLAAHGYAGVATITRRNTPRTKNRMNPTLDFASECPQKRAQALF